jgi:hypothetical protein
MIDFTADAQPEAPADKLLAIKHACEARDRLRQEFDRLTSATAAVQQQLDWIEQRQLPDLMNECGLQSFVLADGRSVTVREQIYAGVTRDNLPAALAWLRRTGNDAIIRHTVGVRFGKGDDATARELARELAKRYGAQLEILNEEQLHPSTLRAFVRARLAGGEDLPRELFGVHTFNKADIKEPQ